MLEVTLNAGAGLARPPGVVRDVDARLDEPRLRSEARALQALAAARGPAVCAAGLSVGVWGGGNVADVPTFQLSGVSP